MKTFVFIGHKTINISVNFVMHIYVKSSDYV